MIPIVFARLANIAKVEFNVHFEICPKNVFESGIQFRLCPVLFWWLFIFAIPCCLHCLIMSHILLGRMLRFKGSVSGVAYFCISGHQWIRWQIYFWVLRSFWSIGLCCFYDRFFLAEYKLISWTQRFVISVASLCYTLLFMKWSGYRNSLKVFRQFGWLE